MRNVGPNSNRETPMLHNLRFFKPVEPDRHVGLLNYSFSTVIVLSVLMFLFQWELHSPSLADSRPRSLVDEFSSHRQAETKFETGYWYISRKSTSVDHTVILPAGKYVLIVGSLEDVTHNRVVTLTHSSLHSQEKRKAIKEGQPLQWTRESSRSLKRVTPLPNPCQGTEEQEPGNEMMKDETKNVVCSRRFFLPAISRTSQNNNSDRTMIAIKGNLLRSRLSRNVWLDDSVSSPEKFERLANRILHLYHNRVARWYRTHLTGKIPEQIQFVITPYLSQVVPSSEPIKMCVSAGKKRGFTRDYPAFSDTIFINSQLENLLGSESDPDLCLATLLAHEMLHLCSLNALYGKVETETALHEWIFEGWAHAAEWDCTGSDSNFATRRTAYLTHPERAALRVQNSVQLHRFREPGIRGAAASFFTFLCQAYPEITWQQRLNCALTPAGIEQLHQQSFETLFRSWNCYEADLLLRNKKRISQQNQYIAFDSRNPLQFTLQGSTAKPIFFEIPSTQSQTDRQLLSIRSNQNSPLQLTIKKYE